MLNFYLMGIWGNNFFSQHILPGRYTAYVEKIIKANYDEINSAQNYKIPKGKNSEIIEHLVKNIEDQQDRKKGLEDKVKAILFGISISISAITFSLSYEQTTISTIYGKVAIAILTLSIFYFISSAIVAVKTLIPVGFGSVQADVQFDKANKEISLQIPNETDNIHQLLKDKLLNDNVNLRINNATYASLKLLRNGIILFALYFVLALTQKLTQIKPVNEYKSSVQVKIYDSVDVQIDLRCKNEHLINVLRDTIRFQHAHKIKKKIKKSKT